MLATTPSSPGFRRRTRISRGSHDLCSVRGADGEEIPPSIPDDLPAIEKLIQDSGARPFVIDPLMAFLVGVDANKDQQVRRALFRLSKIAERNRCCIICMRHLNKTVGTKAIYRGNCSIAVIGHARAGLLVAPDP